MLCKLWHYNRLDKLEFRDIILTMVKNLVIIIIFLTSIISCNSVNIQEKPSGFSSDQESQTQERTEVRQDQITFAGETWKIHSSIDKKTTPGPNYYSNGSNNVWMDDLGKLHIKITQKDGEWYCAHLSSFTSFGYGTYIFKISASIDQLDKNIVFGLFTWDDNPDYNNREIDIEFSKWGIENNDIGQYVVQPSTIQGHIKRFPVILPSNSEESIHTIEWRASSVIFESKQGNDPNSSNTNDLIAQWKYFGTDVPPKGEEKVGIILWLLNELPPSDGLETEIIIEDFQFIP
ncbi:MAG: hypothetical protein ABIE74_06800 [Pseudomonadota bacterium]